MENIFDIIGERIRSAGRTGVHFRGLHYLRRYFCDLIWGYGGSRDNVSPGEDT